MFSAKWPKVLGCDPEAVAGLARNRFTAPKAGRIPPTDQTVNLPQNQPGGFHHLPVLAEEVMAALAPRTGELFVDGTLGGGGHTELLLQAGAHVIGLDRDGAALAHAQARLAKYGEAFHPVRANFRDLPSVLHDLAIDQIDGILLDIGVSSHQLDTATRGFSFQADGPLDMRMDISNGPTAADLVNGADVAELIRIFREYGEEPQAGRIARSLVGLRGDKPFATTGELAAAVASVVPRRGKKHPATHVFQALRIAVNDELGALESILRDAPGILKSGARFAVITFHSLEDRIVKQDFRKRSDAFLDRPEWPAPQPNPDCVYRLLQRKSITATPTELAINPRARSARLRAVQRH